MRKIILILFIIALSICAIACFNGASDNEEALSSSNHTTTESASMVPTTTAPADSASDEQSGGVLAYMDPKIDMLLLVSSVDWVYTKELYEGQVYFYPKDENPMASYNGFAISSQEAGNSTIEQVWNNIKSSFENSIPGFEWSQVESVEVGNYTGYRYHFAGDEFTGDYIFWETGERLYTCSFTSSPDDYDANAKLLISSLESFQTLSEVE